MVELSSRTCFYIFQRLSFGLAVAALHCSTPKWRQPQLGQVSVCGSTHYDGNACHVVHWTNSPRCILKFYIIIHTPFVSSCTIRIHQALCRSYLQSPAIMINHPISHNFTMFHITSIHIISPYFPTFTAHVTQKRFGQLSFCRGQGSKVTGSFCHEECEARHLDPVERTRWDEAAGFHYPAKPLVVITETWWMLMDVDGRGHGGHGELDLSCLLMLMFVGDFFVQVIQLHKRCFSRR